jgi:hypothetical protein
VVIAVLAKRIAAIAEWKDSIKWHLNTTTLFTHYSRVSFYYVQIYIYIERCLKYTVERLLWVRLFSTWDVIWDLEFININCFVKRFERIWTNSSDAVFNAVTIQPYTWLKITLQIAVRCGCNGYRIRYVWIVRKFYEIMIELGFCW